MLKGTALRCGLEGIPTIRLRSVLARKVPLLDLIGHKPIQFLLTSGKPKHPVDTQLLGETVAATTPIAAIRFPSDAAHVASFHGVNVVIFRDKIIAPDSVFVLDNHGKVLEQIP